jgi:23S rRNA (adenine2503-C2)-methyltransferase
MMELVKVVKSQLDKTEKFVFKNTQGYIVEMSYIDNGTNKDIICVPTHTMCNIGCKFCHTTDYIGKIDCKKLTAYEISDGVNFVFKAMGLHESKRTLLVSVMGCGEPMQNVDEVLKSMTMIRDKYKERYVRFAVATCLPNANWDKFFHFTKMVDLLKLDVKVHLSLHYTHDEIRKQWMPNSLEIKPSLDAMSFYKEVTGNKVEIHYALIDGVNDGLENIVMLNYLLRGREFNVKFLFYNEKTSIHEKASNESKYEDFKRSLWVQGIETEYYVPPGISIGGSCGQFLMDLYLESANDKIK